MSVEKVLLISLDSLRRDFVPGYESDHEFEIAAPNLGRFSERAAVFDSHYAGSLPCMPTRREWLTGTQEFLWRPWGPLEPFDNPIPRILRRKKVISQLITDHYHYIQHGSHGYYEDFNGFEFVRGGEYDQWQTAPRDYDPEIRDRIDIKHPDDPEGYSFLNPVQYARNVDDFDELNEMDFFVPRVFRRTTEWIRDNDDWEQWFCYVDSFSGVHEPFHLPEPYASMYTNEDPTDTDLTFWPFYGDIDEGNSELSERELKFLRSQYAGTVTMADRWFGRVLDALDRGGHWDDTMVVVTTDHGFILGEHGWIGKPFEAPNYDTLAHIPLMIWHPDAEKNGERIDALTSSVDLNATILDAYDVVNEMGPHSRSLLPLLDGETDSVRDWALYGYWASSVNITDGERTYLHPCREGVDTECFSTEMMRPYAWFTPREPREDAESGVFLPYTESPVWRYEAGSHGRQDESMAFEVGSDYYQERDLTEESNAVAGEMRSLLKTALNDLDAPDRQYERLGLVG